MAQSLTNFLKGIIEMKRDKPIISFSSDEERRSAIFLALEAYQKELKELERLRKEGLTGLDLQVNRLKAAKKIYQILKN